MITNEQILEILNTWIISGVSIHDYSDYARLQLSHNNFDIWFTKRAYTSKIEIDIELIKTNPVTNATEIIYSSIVPEEICLDVAYLVTKKVKDYAKSKIAEAFFNKEANDFDALMND